MGIRKRALFHPLPNFNHSNEKIHTQRKRVEKKKTNNEMKIKWQHRKRAAIEWAK